MKKIILASQSPRRKELMELMDLDFVQIPSDASEDINTASPEELVSKLSYIKASDIAEKIKNEEISPELLSDESADGYLVIGSDTIVVLGDEVLGKPEDEEDAVRMLAELSGKTHRVLTGVTIIDTQTEKTNTFFEQTEVTFYDLSEDDIREYVETKDPLDKAGAYGIQSRGFRLVKKINGDFNTVVGLPAARLYWELKQLPWNLQ